MVPPAERNDYESFKFGGTAPDNIFVKTNLTDGSGSPISLTNQFPVNSIKDNDKLHDYKLSDIEELSTITYISYLKKDGAWFILKIENDQTFRYVKGDSGYNWSNRGSEMYELFSDIF